MFDKAREYFLAASENNLDLSKEAEDLRVAVIVVLISAARADSNFAESEYETIANLAKNKLGLGESEISRLLKSEALEQSISESLTEIQSSLSLEQRKQILAFTWSIISSDGIADNKESEFAAKIRQELDLSLEVAIAARKDSEGIVIDGFKEFVEASAEVMAGTAAWISNRQVSE